MCPFARLVPSARLCVDPHRQRHRCSPAWTAALGADVTAAAHTHRRIRTVACLRRSGSRGCALPVSCAARSSGCLSESERGRGLGRRVVVVAHACAPSTRTANERPMFARPRRICSFSVACPLVRDAGDTTVLQAVRQIMVTSSCRSDSWSAVCVPSLRVVFRGVGRPAITTSARDAARVHRQFTVPDHHPTTARVPLSRRRTLLAHTDNAERVMQEYHVPLSTSLSVTAGSSTCRTSWPTSCFARERTPRPIAVVKGGWCDVTQRRTADDICRSVHRSTERCDRSAT